MTHRLSFRSLRLAVYQDEKFLSQASGFALRHGKQVFLITNRHVVSGRKLGTNAYIDGKEVFPTRIDITYGIDLGTSVETKSLSIPIALGEAGNRTILWLEHASRAEVDIAIVDISNADIADLPITDPNEPPVKDTPHYRLKAEVPTQIMTIGYPRDIFGGYKGIGVWVQGITASEPALGLHGRDYFLVDSRTAEGMSGSPVFFYLPPHVVIKDKEEGFAFFTTEASMQFVGIYSGRVTTATDLGYVWLYEAILELLDNPVTGDPFYK